MTDRLPQYGEYATPEEQRRLAGLPPLDTLAPEPVAQPSPTPAAAPRSRSIDRVVTLAMLGYGLISVLMNAISYLDLPVLMDRAMQLLGIDGEFTAFAETRLWGPIAAAVLVLGYAVTAFLAVRQLRRGRRAWWIPLVGAAATTVVVSVLLAVPMMSDPAFADFVRSAGS